MDEDDDAAAAEFERLIRTDPRLRLTLASNRAAQPFSQAKLEAAENLLIKAKTALLRGDSARASALADRAVALPFDELEGVEPGLWMAQMMLFDLVTDLVETLDEDDDSWLAGYLAALAGAGADATAVLKALLRAVPATVEVDRRQEGRIRSVAGKHFHDDPLRDRLDRGEVDQAVVILELLHALNVFEAATKTD